ncbi:S8 family serine peptidase [Streptomyces sp. NPDC001876]|uniref:S8 family serine peptidase n=1 Tax=Streptomyces sp. NPDC001876 TaxID=3154402 RepID=UPI0033348600
MFRRRNRSPFASMRTAAAIAAVLAVAGVPLISVPASADTANAQSANADKLGDHDRALIAKYAKQSKSRSVLARAEQAVPDFVTLMLAVKDSRAEETAQALTDLGALVTRTDAEIGYIKANVQFADVDKVLALDGVLRVDADELLALEDTRPDSATGATERPTGGPHGLPAAPSAKTRDDNPYMPTNETGSVDFKEEHRTYDGRGVTIGIIDTGIDPTHPALARTTTGERKLVDTVTGTDPNNLIDLLFDRTWRNFTATSVVTEPTAVRNGVTWTMPPGENLLLNTRILGATTYVDPTLAGLHQGTVYRPSDGAIFVDTDFDHVFSEDELIRPYKVAHEIGYIGTDNPDTELNERQPFTVEFKQFSPTFSGVNINTIDAAHGTHVAGITAAHGIFGGRMDGQAPGAKLVSMRACSDAGGCSSAALTDGMIDLATNHGVDVINMSIGSLPALNDGQSARSLLFNRLIDETGVQMFISAGNSGSGTNTLGDPTAADNVVSVGAAVSKETWWSNYASKVGFKDGIFPFSARGPREDGAMKPDITAPGAAVSPTPDWIASSSVAETGYTLPPGYSMMNGTSMSSPQATGAAALLLGAAKQAGVSATPAELRRAVYSSADYNRNVDAIAQGNGQFNVEKAWGLLSKGVSTSEDISVSAPVCTVLSDKLITPHAGTGLFNSCAPGSGGQGVGEARTYDVTLTRTGGKDGAQSYDLDLTGNDGTFSAPKRVTLEKDVPTVVKVTAAPERQGTHSAVLTIDNHRTRGVEQSTLLTVEAATPLTADTTWSADGTVNRNETVHYTVAVPAGTTSLTVNLSGLADGSQTRWWGFTPEGLSGEKSAAGTTFCYAGYLDGNGCAPATRTYTNPKPGVWEFVVEARRTSPQLSNPFHLESSVTQ